MPSLELTNTVMRESDIILATGGPGMVKVAYSSGKPALGVGVGNAVILTAVMRYNAAEVPTKMGILSQYQYPHALARYAELGRFAGCAGQTDEEVFEYFIAKLEDLIE